VKTGQLSLLNLDRNGIALQKKEEKIKAKIKAKQ